MKAKGVNKSKVQNNHMVHPMYYPNAIPIYMMPPQTATSTYRPILPAPPAFPMKNTQGYPLIPFYNFFPMPFMNTAVPMAKMPIPTLERTPRTKKGTKRATRNEEGNPMSVLANLAANM